MSSTERALPPAKRARKASDAGAGAMDTNGDAGVGDAPGDKLAYWKGKLKEAGHLQLPTDYPHSDLQFAEAEEYRDMSDKLCRDLAKFAMESATQPFTVVLASCAVLLNKYTGESKIAIGTSSETFNPLVIRVDVPKTATFKEVMDATAEGERMATEHDIPFDQLVHALNPEGSHESSIFQVRVFNAVDVNAETLRASSCDWTLFVEQVATTKRILPLRLRLVFNAALFARQRIRDSLKQLEMIVEQMLASPGNAVQACNIVTDEARAVIPDPKAALDDTFFGSIQDKLSECAAKYPDRDLIVHGKTSYSYKMVDEMSNRLANYLISKGIQREDRVALYAHRSSPIVIGIMGILKAGATFTVVDPAYPVQRQNVYLEVARPRGIITLKAAGTLSPEVQAFADENLDVCCYVRDLCMEDLGVLAEASTEPCGVTVGPDSIGTLSFTSGSTGKPKAVRGRHISLTHFYPWMGSEFGMSEKDRFSMLSGIAHDPIQRDIFTPIFFGASIYIPDAEDIHNPGQLAKWVAANEVNILHLTPAMGQLLTANATTMMPSIRCVLLVGDILTKRDVKRLQRLGRNATVVNMFGTTETQRAVSYLKIPNDNSIDIMKEVLPAGIGMKDVQLLVLNDAGNMCGVGEIGEVYVRSPHLSAGYLGLPDKTAEKFLPNKFASVPANPMMDRMYRTGDVGRYTTSGIVECTGRADDQIKIRGFRIELGEIDLYLSQHKDVRENKTLVMRDANEEKQIISFFVPMTEDYDIDSIRKHMQKKLASYAVPSIFCPLSKMPLTPNGKVDKNKLPYPDTAIILAQQRSVAQDDDSMAISPLERQIKGIFEQVLGRPIRIGDNFFEVGGHSILATRLTFQLREAIKQDFPLNMLYQYPSVKALSTAVTQSSIDPSLELMGSSRESAEKIDPAQEVMLDASIAANGRTFDWAKAPEGIFLTGATGFLGAFLLSELLTKFPTATVRCLVRAKDNSSAFDRIVSNLKNHFCWKEAYAPRVVPVVGDLAKPMYGLSAEAFGKLAEVTNAVFHNGALVHWVYPYSKLKAANVGGTVEALRLATAGTELAAVHFVSSTSVFDSSYYVEQLVEVPESDALQGGSGLTVGYAQSKWIAELTVMEAQKRGVPALIFRPGFVGGHSSRGVMNTDDFLLRLLKGCLQLGKAPEMINHINICPVDFVARALVHVASAGQPPRSGAFHFFNPTPFRYSDYFGGLRQFFPELASVDYLQWREELMKLTLTSRDNALYPLMHFVLDDLPVKSRSAALDTTELDHALQGSGIECPAIQSLMPVYISYLVKVGYLPEPRPDLAEALPDLGIDAKDLTSVQRSSAAM